jgi:hypothetical protein
MKHRAKSRRDMTDYEKALDWRDRLAPRWWLAVYITFGVAGGLFIASILVRFMGN